VRRAERERDMVAAAIAAAEAELSELRKGGSLFDEYCEADSSW
jgi:hypothetical protein